MAYAYYTYLAISAKMANGAVVWAGCIGVWNWGEGGGVSKGYIQKGIDRKKSWREMRRYDCYYLQCIRYKSTFGGQTKKKYISKN